MVEFDWDTANIDHLKAHRVTSREFEQAIASFEIEHFDFDVVSTEERFQSVSPTDSGRLLFLVWTLREGRVRAVTAYDANFTAKRAWEERKR